MDLGVIRAGIVDYDSAWALQRELATRREPVLLLMEHPPVITLGRNADPSNVLDAGHVPVRRTDRGGDVTYHGPGMLMGYPLLDVRAMRVGPRTHVDRIERSLVAALEDAGVAARRREDCVGVWTDAGKIASIGVRISNGMTMHGFCLIVNSDLSPFSRIHPCGVPACAVTSVSERLGRRVEVAEMADRFVPRFLESYGFARAVPATADFTCGVKANWH